ncbi:hypothetical protein LPAF129_06920 [Ligilactobacillus pabuli]|uniref:Sulfatase N-terminal domain-containing protein n=1 Tax=Ligilactobacillus pabuli TaxID=2886039 RepID=A0ABQ5JHM2_9LACO|nr:alkaline phosphatase family protein [Ligilactobacillus pabuli]GKS81007.1 hypothetical protein LPAF129_06920 [Ligilactobacillus pabuli]
MEKKQHAEFLKKINWRLKGKNTLIILRTIGLMLFESMVIVAVTQALQLNNVDAGLIWAIGHKRIFVIVSLGLTLLGIALCAFIGRFWTANTILVIFGTAFAFINQQKHVARSEPLLPSDLIFIKEPREMLKMANQNILLKIIAGIVVLILLTILFERFFPVKWQNSRLFLAIRVLIVGITVIGFSGLNKINIENSAMNNLSNWMGNDIYFWDSNSAANKNGPWLNFINFLGSKTMEKPSNYSKQTMRKIANKYTSEAKQINQTRKNKDINQQTLIYVLSESYSDPKRVPNMKVNQNPVPEIDEIKKNNTSGLMLSSGYGGGTANIEYGVETSWNLQMFDSSMTTPFTQIVMKSDYNPSVVDLFKRKNAIHPFLGTFYQRREAYQRFGFQTFRTLDGKSVDEKLRYRKNIQNSDLVGDDEAYKDVLWQLKRERRGQFISLATMQNHLPFTDKYDEYPFEASGQAVANPERKEQVKHYMQGIALTSKFTKEFIEQLDHYQRPITVVWYGDHLPGIYDGNNMNEYYVPLHETDYFIYSNKYAREHGDSIGKQTSHVQVISPNFFTALALKQMNQKVNPFYAMMTKVVEDLPAQSRGNNDTSDGLLVDDKNRLVQEKDLTQKQKILMRDYRLVQYDNTAGKKYLKKMNFMK